MKNKTAISQLFRNRDKAIETQNRELFMSTQAGELNNGSFEGYISVEKLITEVLYIHQPKENVLQAIVLAKESYIPKEKPSYASFVLYYLIDTKVGWKIYRLGF